MNCYDEGEWPGLDDDDDEPMDLEAWWELQVRACADIGVEPPRGIYSGEPIDLETVKLILQLFTKILGIFVPARIISEAAERIRQHLRDLG